MKKPTLLLLASFLLMGCASKHAYVPKSQAVYGAPQWECSEAGCAVVRYQIPSQLTPAGCVAHSLVTLHKAEECKK